MKDERQLRGETQETDLELGQEEPSLIGQLLFVGVQQGVGGDGLHGQQAVFIVWKRKQNQ